MSNVTLLNMDCMEYMATLPDKAFELAIVDPPYGIMDEMRGGGAGKLKNRILNNSTRRMIEWDNAPAQEYFDELFRITKNQIIWGMNYFVLPVTRGVICWDKVQPWENFSQIELAWTSFDYPARLYRFDNRTGGKIHPTQKPVALYQWLLKNYAKQGDKILDTHGGSMSSVIACINMGFSITALEIDKDYFEAGCDRIKRHLAQEDFTRPSIEMKIGGTMYV